MLAVRGMTWNLDRDDVLGHVLAVVCAEPDPADPGAEESASCLVLAPARQFALSKQAFVLRGLLGTDVDDDDVELAHDTIMNGGVPPRSGCRLSSLAETCGRPARRDRWSGHDAPFGRTGARTRPCGQRRSPCTWFGWHRTRRTGRGH